jgi:hypothetical protein
LIQNRKRRRKRNKQRCQLPVRVRLEAIRVVNHFYEARAGTSKIVSQILGIEGHLENQY